jgi:hypothetical protein
MNIKGIYDIANLVQEGMLSPMGSKDLRYMTILKLRESEENTQKTVGQISDKAWAKIQILCLIY